MHARVDVSVRRMHFSRKNWILRANGPGYAPMLNSYTTTVHFPPEVLKINVNDETLWVVVILENSHSKQMQGQSVLSARVLCVLRKMLQSPERKERIRNNNHFLNTSACSCVVWWCIFFFYQLFRQGFI